ncbi:MAG: MFS transporter [Thermaurantiacus sp.]
MEGRAHSSLPRQELALVFAALLVTAAGNTALHSVLPVIGRELHIPDLGIALIFSLSALLWTITAPFWARQSDLRGRRLLMGVGVAGFAVSMLLSALVVLAGVRGLISGLATLGLFMLTRTLFGIFGAAANPAAQAYVASRTSAEQRTPTLAILASAFGLGTILGPALAPFFILPVVGLAGPMFAFAGIAVVVLAALWRGLPNDDPGARSGRGAAAAMPDIGNPPTGASVLAAEAASASGIRLPPAFRDRRVRPFLVYGLLVGSLQAATFQAIGFLIIDRMAAPGLEAAQLIGITLMAGAGATLLAQWGIIRILAMSPKQLVQWGTWLAAIGTVGIALAPAFYQLVLAFAVASAGYGFARPGFTAGASLAVTRAEQGAVAGAVTSVNGACFIVAPAAGIALYGLSPLLPYWLGAAALAALAIWVIGNRTLSPRD